MEFHNQNYSYNQIEAVLSVIKDCVKKNRFNVELNENREKNVKFIEKYNLSSKRQKEILLGIKVEDFCHSLKNTKKGYEHEILYVFIPEIKLFGADGNEVVEKVYIKFNILEYGDSKRTIVISFHDAERKSKYLFK